MVFVEDKIGLKHVLSNTLSHSSNFIQYYIFDQIVPLPRSETVIFAAVRAPFLNLQSMIKCRQRTRTLLEMTEAIFPSKSVPGWVGLFLPGGETWERGRTRAEESLI